eukprot:bmy_10506T0
MEWVALRTDMAQWKETLREGGFMSLLERARDYLHKTGRFIVIGGIVSPVHDSYGKQGLVSSRHRLIMCQLAVQNSDWIRVDPWECYQDTWQTTCSVLEHHRELMKRVTGCILSNVNTPSMTPILGKVGESLSRICCVRPPVERFTFVDENANLGTVMRYEEIELRILLLCGSDLLESFCIPGLWNEADVSSKVMACAQLAGGKYHPRIPLTREKGSRGEKLIAKVALKGKSNAGEVLYKISAKLFQESRQIRAIA